MKAKSLRPDPDELTPGLTEPKLGTDLLPELEPGRREPDDDEALGGLGGEIPISASASPALPPGGSTIGGISMGRSSTEASPGRGATWGGGGGVVPEPGALLQLAVGLAFVLGVGRRRLRA